MATYDDMYVGEIERVKALVELIHIRQLMEDGAEPEEVCDELAGQTGTVATIYQLVGDKL